MKCPICGINNVRRGHKNRFGIFSKFMTPEMSYRYISCDHRYRPFKKTFQGGFIRMSVIFGIIIVLGFIGSIFLFQGFKAANQLPSKPSIYQYPMPKDTIQSKEKISHIIPPEQTDHMPKNSYDIQGHKKTVSNESLSEIQKAPSLDPALINFDWMPSFDWIKEPDASLDTETVPIAEKQEENKKTEDIGQPHHPVTPNTTAKILAYSEKNVARIEKPAISPTEKINSEQQILKTIDYKPLEDGFKAFIETKEPVSKYRSFFLPEPLRLVIDLPGSWNNEAKRIYKVNANKVKKIRTWVHPGKLRIVVDLTDTQMPSHVLEKSTRGLVLAVTFENTEVIQ